MRFESLICNFYLSMAASKLATSDPSVRYTNMLQEKSLIPLLKKKQKNKTKKQKQKQKTKNPTCCWDVKQPTNQQTND